MSDTPKGRRILLVDDESVQRMAMKLALQSMGFVCFGVDTAAQALVAAVAQDIDVVLLEWLLVSGGAEGLTAELRTRCREAGRSVRIAIVSTRDEPEGIRDAEGLDAYFTKPVVITDIARWINGNGG
jgi:DNA-binding response OmpR family regulator